MKKSMITIIFLWLFTVLSGGSVFAVTPVEQVHARQKLIELKKKIQTEQSAYQLALLADLSEDEKTQLTEKYTHDRKKMFQQVREQRDIIADRMMSPMQKMLWNTAKFAGGAVLVVLAVYNFFSTSPTKVKIVPEFPVSVPVDKNASHQNALQQVSQHNLPLDLAAPLSPLHNESQQIPSLTNKDIQRYRDISNTFGKAGSMLTFLSMGIPALLPFAIAVDLSAIYYGLKTVDLKPMNLTPILLDEIRLLPEDMPY